VARTIQLIRRDLNTGVDELTIDLHGPNKGAQGVAVNGPIKGLTGAPRTPIREAGAFQVGTNPGEPRIDELMIDLPVLVHGETPAEYDAAEDLLREVLDWGSPEYRWGVEYVTVLRISTPRTPPREVFVQLDRTPADAFDADPDETLEQMFNLTLVAPDPLWQAQPLTDAILRSEMTLQGDGITWLGYVTIANPSQYQSYLQWASNELEATTTITLPDGIGVYPPGHDDEGEQVMHELPPLGVGKEFLVDTYPLTPTLDPMDDSQEWANMAGEDFEYPLPRRTPPTLVPVKVVGGTANLEIRVWCPQRYDRPQGG
jgi:hypothetical protein